MNRLVKLFKFEYIRTKIAAVTMLIVFVITATLVLLDFLEDRSEAINNSEQTALADARFYAELTKSQLENALDASINLAKTMSSVKESKNATQFSRQQVLNLLRHYLEINQDFFGVGVFWEPNAFDKLDTMFANTNGHDKTGAFVPYWYRDNKGSIGLTAYSDAYTSDFYRISRRSQKDVVLDPHIFKLGDKDVLITTFISPILLDYYFYGIVGFDIPLTNIVNTVMKANIYEGKAQLIITSNNGTLVAVSDRPDLSGRPMKELFDDYKDRIAVIKTAQIGIEQKNDILEVKAPVVFGNTGTPWQVMIRIPQTQVLAEATSDLWTRMLLSLFMVFVSMFIALYFVNRLMRPLATIPTFTNQLSEGDLYATNNIETPSIEMHNIKNALGTLTTGLQRVANFATQVGKGNLEEHFQPLGEKDVLGNALLDMQKSLKEARENEQRRQEEDAKRNWTAEGLTRFNEIVRQSNLETTEMAYLIISNLVSYLKINQGGIFIYEETDEGNVLELMAAQAYDRRRMNKTFFKMGEGLIGTCAVERSTFYIRQIPDDYIKITSGLGLATPRELLIVPLVLNNEIFGVVELASFDEFERYKIDFVERLAETIAATLANSRVTTRTRTLIEQTQRQAEDIKLRENEIRNNIEALRSAQETLARNDAEMKSLLEAINHSTLVAEYNLEGSLISINERFCEIFQRTREELIGKHIIDIIGEASSYSIKFRTLWDKVNRGEFVRQTRSFANAVGDDIWLSELYYPIVDNTRRPVKILNIAFDITEAKENEQAVTRLLDETRQKTEQLMEQEQAMLQNMEEMMQQQEQIQQELNRINEEAAKKEQEFTDKIKELERKLRKK